MPDLAPEARAREQIDALLTAAGWTLQNYDRFDPTVARFIALREIPVKGGRCDYMLLADRVPISVVEAKKAGTTLSAVAEQSLFYGNNIPDFLQQPRGPLAFYYESTGVETFFRDARDPQSRSRRVFAFHRPETLVAQQALDNTLRGRLREMSPLTVAGMRGCQVEAITSLEKAFAHGDQRSLIQMARQA